MTFALFIDEIFAKSERANNLIFILDRFYDDEQSGLVGLPDEGRNTRPS